MGAFVYILRCADGSLYVGSTRVALEERIAQHSKGHFAGYTSARLPVTLVYAQEFDRIADAVAAEQKLKGWSRMKKQALIDDRLDVLPELARRRLRFEVSN
ncbi:MAG: GIY-YIG nuclease family protein [Rhodospirillaceae bacterium]